MTDPSHGWLRSAWIKIRPRDLSTLSLEGRARERHKRIGLSALASLGARGLGLGTIFVTLPLTIRYLGTEQFGLWTTITSVSALLEFANLGLSYGLMNGISEAHGRNDRDSARRDVSSVFYVLLAVMVILGVAFAGAYGVVPWSRVFNVASPNAAAVAGPAMAVYVALALVGLPLSAARSIRDGYQEGYTGSLFQVVGSVISLVGLVIVIGARADLPWLVLALGGGSILAALLNAVVVVRRRPWLIPRVNLATVPAVRRMFRMGLLFFILAIAGAVAFQTDNIVIAQILGAEQVTQYAVPMKLFMIAPLLLNLALMPLWPAYREALTRGELAWVRRTLVRSLFVAAAVGVSASGVLLLVAIPLLHAWAGAAVTPAVELLLALASWGIVVSLSGPIAMYLNGANALRFQAVVATAMMVANLLLSIALTNAIGISGPAWGSVIAQVIFVLLPSAVYLRRTLGTTQGHRDS